MSLTNSDGLDLMMRSIPDLFLSWSICFSLQALSDENDFAAAHEKAISPKQMDLVKPSASFDKVPRFYVCTTLKGLSEVQISFKTSGQ